MVIKRLTCRRCPQAALFLIDYLLLAVCAVWPAPALGAPGTVTDVLAAPAIETLTPTPTVISTETPNPNATPTTAATPTPTPTTTIPGAIGGVVWHDRDDDGSQDPGEPGLAEVTLRLLRWDSQIAETQTAPDGSYRFAPLVPGALYGVREAQPTGWRWSTTSDEVQMALANGQEAVANFGDWNGWPTWLPLIVR